MLPRVKWGLITGGAVAIFNLCAAPVTGGTSYCFSILPVMIAAVVAGYFCALQEPTGEAVKAGGIAGTIAGVISLISQIVGGVILGLLGVTVLSSAVPLPDFFQTFGSGIVMVVVLLLCGGLISIVLAAGTGALTAKIATEARINAK